jgi:hypothetical protein
MVSLDSLKSLTFQPQGNDYERQSELSSLTRDFRYRKYYKPRLTYHNVRQPNSN